MRRTRTRSAGKRRARLRAQGLRPVTLWLPDTRSPRFAAECRRQSRLLRDDPSEAEALDAIEAAADWGEA